MIYIPYQFGPVLFKIPINLGRTADNTYSLKLFNTVTRRQYEATVEDSAELLNYYIISFDFTKDMEQGEYEYSLVDPGDSSSVYSTGLMRFGELRETTKQPGTESININYKYPKVTYGTEAD